MSAAPAPGDSRLSGTSAWSGPRSPPPLPRPPSRCAATCGSWARSCPPRSVDAADCALRQFARWMLTDAGITVVCEIRRDDIKDYKVWLASQPGHRGRLAAETHRQRVRTIRQFFERIIERDWPDAPPRNPVIAGDIPKKPEPLPKFLDDHDAARLMAAARASTDPRDRLVVELLARTAAAP